MTKKELKQIYYLNREITMWQNELDKLRCKCLVKSPIISDMPRGGKSIDLADYVAEMADYEAIIKGLLAKVQVQRKRIMDYIEEIDDSLMRQIVYLRNVCLMGWEEVAKTIGGGNSGEYIRVKYYRYFKKNDTVCTVNK